MFVTFSHFTVRLIFAGEAGAYPNVAPFGTPEITFKSCKRLFANIRLGGKRLKGTNTLAYYCAELKRVIESLSVRSLTCSLILD